MTEAGLTHWIGHLETKGFWYEGSNREDFLTAVTALRLGWLRRGKTQRGEVC